jgi:uncharacterized protein (TIGR02996 family)
VPVSTPDDVITAMNQRDLPEVEYLLGQEPKLVNAVSATHQGSPFHHALRSGRREFALYFIAHGADLELRDGEGKTPLELVIEAAPNLTQVQVDERTLTAQTLLEKGSPLTEPLLLNACLMGGGKAKALVTTLLARGAEVTAVHPFSGYTVLHAAAEYDHPEAFTAALGKVDVDAVTTTYPRGTTALHLAVRKRATKRVQQLVKAGARADLLDERRDSALAIAPKNLRPLLEGKQEPKPEKKVKAAAVKRPSEQPNDARTLSVFADWLVEHGEEARAEYLQLCLLPKPTSDQKARRALLSSKHRDTWLKAGRALVSSSEESTETPGFLAKATVTPEKLLAGFEAVCALGPRLIVEVTPLKTRATTKKLAALPLGTLYGLTLKSVDDDTIELLAPALRGLKHLTLAPRSADFTQKGLAALAEAVGKTLEVLHFEAPPQSFVSLSAAKFPALRQLKVHLASTELRARLTAEWKQAEFEDQPL